MVISLSLVVFLLFLFRPITTNLCLPTYANIRGLNVLKSPSSKNPSFQHTGGSPKANDGSGNTYPFCGGRYGGWKEKLNTNMPIKMQMQAIVAASQALNIYDISNCRSADYFNLNSLRRMKQNKGRVQGKMEKEWEKLFGPHNGGARKRFSQGARQGKSGVVAV
ncbi:hypothetical protein L484_023360 [Morus notabilis]|uniref:Uncharacterized protein n=1 Tax=Morus notabilis TaxID=981085 RepID=W9SDG2_9ROSA|nr:hypothetical protein L484_023360 [Morus notabilis]